MWNFCGFYVWPARKWRAVLTLNDFFDKKYDAALGNVFKEVEDFETLCLGARQYQTNMFTAFE